jgi:modulator of FtsH protease HflK
MSQTFNPFEHHHDHGADHGQDHDHATEGLEVGPADPAQRALGDALRVTFAILKGVILILLVLYAGSGFFNVSNNERAVRLRFGKIVGEGEGRVLGPGWYVGLPFPIDQVVKVKIAPQQLQLDKEFWFEVKENSEGKTESEMPNTRPLNPEKDGSLLTGDANILHARLVVEYQVQDPLLYLEHVQDDARAAALVRAAAQDAVVFAVAQLSADDAFSGQFETTGGIAKKRARETLDAMKTGITVTKISKDRFLFPGSVRDAFLQVSNAQSQRTSRLNAAQSKWNTVLGGTAGEAAEPLLAILDQYGLAVHAHDDAKVKAIDAQLDRAFRDLWLDTPAGKLKISGEVAQRIDQGKAESVDLVNKVRGESELFSSILEEYRKSPQIVLSRLWEQARQEILGGDVETFYLPNGQVYMVLNRDPKIRKAREEAALQAQQQPQQQPGTPSGPGRPPGR